jgi:hypothetical protein
MVIPYFGLEERRREEEMTEREEGSGKREREGKGNVEEEQRREDGESKNGGRGEREECKKQKQKQKSLDGLQKKPQLFLRIIASHHHLCNQSRSKLEHQNKHVTFFCNKESFLISEEDYHY